MTYRLRNIAIAIALAILAALLTTFYVTNYKRDVQKSEELVNVYVASRDIPAGTSGADVFEKSLLQRSEVARRSVIPGAVSSPAQVSDLVATDTIYAGEQVTARRFAPASEQGVLAQVSGNQRVLQVPGDQHQLLAGTLKAGDRVDVVASIKFRVRVVDSEGGRSDAGTEVERTASRVVLRDLLVLRAAQKPAVEGKLTSGVSTSSSVLLALTDSQAQKLFFVLRNSDWSLQLRPTTDPADSPESVETVESVLRDGLKDEQLAQLFNGQEAR